MQPGNQTDVEAIRAAVDIVEVVGAHVSLRKSGRNFVGLCPFHPEKTPSFSVTAEKKLYHCFGVGGDVFDFLMRLEGLDFHGAVRRLGKAAGLAVEPLSNAARQRQAEEEGLAAVNRAAKDFFHRCLLRPCGEKARAYLASRHIPAKLARAQALGFGGPSAEMFASLTARGMGPERLAAAGLLTEDGRRHLFEGRLIFPICAADGQVVGFGGRRLDDAHGGPKYINSREGRTFAKRRLLYGISEAAPSIRRLQRAVVMEGYTDVLAAWRSGLGEAVGVLGTALTHEHGQSLRRLTKEVILCLDGDAAGRRAALASSAVLYQAGLGVRVAPLPAGEDPDSLLRAKGAEPLRQAIDGARAAPAYFMDVAFAADDPPGSMSVEARAAAARQLQPLLVALGPGLERDLYSQRLAQRVGVSLAQLQEAWRRAVPAKKKRQEVAPQAMAPAPQPGASGPPMPLTRELELLRELLLFPQLRSRFGEIAEYAISPGAQALLEELADPGAALESVVTRHIVDPGWQRRLLQVVPRHAAMQSSEAQEGDDDGYSSHTFEAVMARFKRAHVETALRDVLEQMRQFEARGEATVALMRRKQQLTAAKRALKNILPRGPNNKLGP